MNIMLKIGAIVEKQDQALPGALKIVMNVRVNFACTATILGGHRNVTFSKLTKKKTKKIFTK